MRTRFIITSFIILFLLLLLSLPAFADTFTPQHDGMELERLAFLINCETRNSRTGYCSDSLLDTTPLTSLLTIQKKANTLTYNLFQTFFPFENYRPKDVQLDFNPSCPGLLLNY